MQTKKALLLSFTILLCCVCMVKAETCDSLQATLNTHHPARLCRFQSDSGERIPDSPKSRWEIGALFSPGKVIVMDEYQRRFQRNDKTTAFALQLDYTPLPESGNPFASDYNYPTFGFGIKYNHNDITMHRAKADGWRIVEEADYESRMGDIITAYSTFSRPLLVLPKAAMPGQRTFQIDYMLGAGIGFSNSKYSPADCVDNELIGSLILIYFTAGTHATYFFTPEWAAFAGLEFYHHSNGAVNRPNKGANYIGPVVGVKRTISPSNPCTSAPTNPRTPAPTKYYLSFALGVGAKTLNEDWQITQFYTQPDDPDYRTAYFHVYTSYSLQADIMCRYARRWASGIGADLFYGSYADRIRDIENRNMFLKPQAEYTPQKVSPWSFGLAAKHNVYYGNLSLRMSVGYYLYRHMGSNAKEVEKPYYERIGVHYSFPSLGGLTIGANVKAHYTKADLTEFVVAYPLSLNN